MAYKNKDKRKQTVKRLRLKRKEGGLCVYCGSKAVVGLTLCPEHLQKRRLFTRKYYQAHSSEIINKHMELYKKYKQEGRCVACGAPLTEEDEVTRCAKCAGGHNQLSNIKPTHTSKG